MPTTDTTADAALIRALVSEALDDIMVGLSDIIMEYIKERFDVEIDGEPYAREIVEWAMAEIVRQSRAQTSEFLAIAD